MGTIPMLVASSPAFVINAVEHEDISLLHRSPAHPLEGSSNGGADPVTLRPIIGILAQEKDSWVKDSPANTSSYIAASYVKSVEAAGARVVPVQINQDDEYYEKLGKSLNGFLLPGGGASITSSKGYAGASNAIYQIVLAANKEGSPLPLWSTCLGFEMLLLLAADGQADPRTSCESYDRALPLNLSPGWSSSQMFGGASEELMEAAQTKDLTSNFHHYCVTPETFSEDGQDKDYVILSTNEDDDGLTFISSVEHKEYPIFGVQWHPEKNTYEWQYPSIPHSPEAIQLEHHVMEVFLSYARMNSNSFEDEDEAEKYLIYNHQPTYVHRDYDSKSFEQAYLFFYED